MSQRYVRWLFIGNGSCFDVLFQFVNDHPGGADIVLQHAGTDIAEVFYDDAIHGHSKAAYEMLQDYYIGDLVAADFLPDDEGVDVEVVGAKSNSKVPYGMGTKKPFIDTSKGMLSQIFHGNFSKEFYLEQVIVFYSNFIIFIL